ncbi:helix-turn-helix transcriptional regulator [Limimaricola hongkongensis]|uniref:Regulatory protein, LuxR n=1 Tax=Limimaricola hongkongensis DSM 17492 TaxID=1122180 RepID=A0A017HBP8_9RHOB|nr:helix-turn-helix transcriptional regulator [Limimaricola hongkongensis]EYD71932.1 regulatory protein, LuxR [Limimaricola hongkongensis DSM 17492]
MLDDIYQGALTPDPWAALPGRIAAMAGGGAWALQLVRPGLPRRAELHGCNFDPALTRLYPDRFAALNPWLDQLLRAPELHLVQDDRMIRGEAFFASAFYTGFLQPQGDIHRCFGTLLVRDDTGSLVLSCNHAPDQAGTVGRAGPRLLLQIAPHLRRAIGLMRAARHDALRKGVRLLDGLDGRQACFVIDRRGHLIVSDSRGTALLEQGGLLRLAPGGRLRFSEPEANAALDRALAQGDRPAGRFALGPGPRHVRLMALPDDTMIAPLRALLAGGRAAAALIVPEAGASDRLDAELTRLYALTRAETLVLRLLCEGHAIPEIAARRGVSINTVRNQMRSLFDKTGTRRQAELVVLATRLGANRADIGASGPPTACGRGHDPHSA